MSQEDENKRIMVTEDGRIFTLLDPDGSTRIEVAAEGDWDYPPRPPYCDEAPEGVYPCPSSEEDGSCGARCVSGGSCPGDEEGDRCIAVVVEECKGGPYTGLCFYVVGSSGCTGSYGNELCWCQYKYAGNTCKEIPL